MGIGGSISQDGSKAFRHSFSHSQPAHILKRPVNYARWVGKWDKGTPGPGSAFMVTISLQIALGGDVLFSRR